MAAFIVLTNLPIIIYLAKLSTRPYDVRLYLPDLVEMVDNPLPSTAVLFVSSDTAHELPPNIVTSVITLTVS